MIVFSRLIILKLFRSTSLKPIACIRISHDPESFLGTYLRTRDREKKRAQLVLRKFAPLLARVDKLISVVRHARPLDPSALKVKCNRSIHRP